MTSSSSGLKLIYSKIQPSSTTATTTTPVIVLENLGAQRCTDMVEVYRVIQLLTVSKTQHQADSSSEIKMKTILSPELKTQTSKILGVPSHSIIHAATVPKISIDETTTTTGRRDREESSSYFHFDLIWHYGWQFSIIVPKSSPTQLEFLSELCSKLSRFRSEGKRLERGSAAQNQKKEETTTISNVEEEHVTTLPTEIIASLIPNLPTADLIQLYQASSPPVKLCGYPSHHTLVSKNNNNFFLVSPKLPGLWMVTNFLSQEEEASLLERVQTWQKNDAAQDQSKNLWQNLNLRRVRHFGRRFDYSSNNVFEEKMIPLVEIPWIKTLLEKIHNAMRQSKLFDRKENPSAPNAIEDKEWHVDQMTVSEYKSGAGIPPHLDHPVNFGSIIIAVAVGAPTLFEFSKVASNNNNHDDDNDDDAEKQQQTKKENTKCSVLFPPRALMVMQGEARYGWKHSIAARGRDFLFMEECCVDESTTSETKNHNECLSCCSLERDTRISFTFRRVTMEN
jgi:alkylated DNA repair dioxygenase AlkB